MASYYDSNKATSANSLYFILDGSDKQHFPLEGLCIGSLNGGEMELPALVDICEVKAFCMLYNNEDTRTRVNHVLEKLAWRIAITVPANLCEIVLYNGGNAGDSFNTHSQLHTYLVGDRNDRVLFDGNADVFDKVVSDAYASIVQRMSAINCAGKRTLVELNESLGLDARMKYQFFILTDFPRKIKMQTVQKLAQIIETGSRAGIYVMMSWDMNADFSDAQNGSSSFDAQAMLKNMEMVFPKDGAFYFSNSGHDDVLNRFMLTLDDAAIDPEEANTWATYIYKVVEEAKENAETSKLKQDFAQLEKTPYKPVMSEISVTVGLDVNDKHAVSLKFDSGHYIHGFVLGKSGSGKSVLLNTIICSAILQYSPQDLMLYLMDFKGVEFNKYRGLKHTKAVLVEANDPNLTLEVLRELWTEYERRKDLFDEVSLKNIDGYNRKCPENHLPQILFVTDECQEMLRRNNSSDNDALMAIQNEISTILDKLARLGRFAGIHMLMATQQLDGVNLPESVKKNLSECFLLLSAPSDSNELVPESGDITSKQMAGIACYYHDQRLQSQVQSFYADDDEIATIIEMVKRKTEGVPSNGGYYFSGSSVYHLKDDLDLLNENYNSEYQSALIGHKLGINAGITAIPLLNDFSENIIVFGVNKKEQAIGVVMNTLASLILSYKNSGIDCDFLVIDCLVNQNARYKDILQSWNSKGLCRIIPRRESGKILKGLIEDISSNTTRPTVLTIIGQDHFMEVRKNLSLDNQSVQNSILDNDMNIDSISLDSIQDLEVDENAIIPALTEEDMALLQIPTSQQEYTETVQEQDQKKEETMSYSQAIQYIINEGPIQGIHVLMQVDKPRNILFSDDDADYKVIDLMDKFRHKIILRSENKIIQPMRFSHDIDVQSLSDDEKHLRAYYYPEGDDPILFTPYLMPNPEII